MATVILRIEPHFCGPLSVGTVEHAKLIREHLKIGLAEAKAFVDRATFDGETVSIEVPDRETAEVLANALATIEGPAVTEAFVAPDRNFARV